MIFYFSATGNCKYVATRLAEVTNEAMWSIGDCMKQSAFDFALKDHENLGFVVPVYHWGLPSIVVDFMDRLTISARETRYAYNVLTFGTATGQAHRMMEKLLRSKGLGLDGKFNVRMVDTWTPLFDLSNPEKNAKALERGEKQLRLVLRQVAEKTAGDFDRRKIPFAQLYYQTYKRQRETRRFTVDGNCISCGRCARQCPVLAIEMQGGKPVWVKSHCALCLGCLHRCPTFSIQYGKRTRKHGQYVNPNVKLS